MKTTSGKIIPSSNEQEPRRRRWWPAWFNRDLGLLFGGRGLRSFAQAYLAIIVPIYLAQLGFDAVHLGIVFTAAAATSALLTALVGFLSDRFGRKALLILIALMMAGGGLVFAISSNFIVLVIAGALGTIGRGGGAGSGGAFGPYYPAEQALIAEHASDTSRTTIFGALSFVGVMTGALGSLLASLPVLAQQHIGFSLSEGYRLLFFLTALIGIAMALIVLPVRERPHVMLSKQPEEMAAAATQEVRRIFGLSRQSWNLIWRFMVTNTTNGLAIGVLGPFMVYWFYRRYGVNADAIAGVFFVINLAAALPYLLAGRLARRLGAVRTVVSMRAISVVLLFVMTLMPTFLLAGALYLLRMIANTLSNPVRQSYLMGIIPPEERSSAAGLSNLPSQISASISPYITGYLIQAVSLNLPLELAALLQAINTILYYSFFHKIRPPEERREEDVKTNVEPEEAKE